MTRFVPSGSIRSRSPFEEVPASSAPSLDQASASTFRSRVSVKTEPLPGPVIR